MSCLDSTRGDALICQISKEAISKEISGMKWVTRDFAKCYIDDGIYSAQLFKVKRCLTKRGWKKSQKITKNENLL